MRPGVVPFEAKLDVTEPMGMETFVYFDVAGVPASGRVSRTGVPRWQYPA
jgi:multiple sugar transport system ATP-binding protein